MIKLSDVEWQEFKISEIFIFNRGKRYKRQDHLEGNYKYIASTSFNNGIDSYVGETFKNKVVKNAIGLNNSGSVGKAFYHKDKCIYSDHVTWLKPKNKTLNEFIACFIITLLERNKNKYSFGREINNTRLKREKILLPIDSEKKPNWEFMEKYIRERTKNIIFKSKTNIKYDTSLKLNFVNWKEFKIKNLFLIKRGKRLKSVDRWSGHINYYSTSNFNNGLTDKISNPLFIEKNSLIFTTFGYCYYVDNNFTASDEVNILQIQNMELNKEIALFLVSILNQIKYKYSFGRKAFMNRLINETISLPINENDQPNWEFMEKYIRERTKNIYL